MCKYSFRIKKKEYNFNTDNYHFLADFFLRKYEDQQELVLLLVHTVNYEFYDFIFVKIVNKNKKIQPEN